MTLKNKYTFPRIPLASWLFYEFVGPISFERLYPLENKDEELATKKHILKLTNAIWVPVLRWAER